MHPILGQSGRLGPYLLAWVPLAGVLLYLLSGPGGLTTGRAVKLDLSPYDWVIGISDIQLRGHADLVVRARTTGALYLIPGSATRFGRPRFLAQGMGVYNLAG